MTPRRAQLKAATNTVHEALHDLPPFCQIAEGTFGADDVRTFEHLHQSCWSGYASRDHNRVFEAVFNVSAAHFFHLEAYSSYPDPKATALDPGMVCGAGYVYLGSKFGGQLLGRQLQDKGYDALARQIMMTPVDKARWRMLMDQLETLSPVQFDACIREANIAFSRFLPKGGVASLPAYA